MPIIDFETGKYKSELGKEFKSLQPGAEPGQKKQSTNKGLIDFETGKYTSELEKELDNADFFTEAALRIGGATDEDLRQPEVQQQPVEQSGMRLMDRPVAPQQIEDVRGGVEALGTLATGATGGAAGFAGGAVEGLVREGLSGEFGTPEAAQRVQETALQRAGQFTYQPRTERGQEIVQGISETLKPLEALAPLGPQVAGARIAATGAPLKAPKIPGGELLRKFRNRADADIISEIKSNPNPVRLEQNILKGIELKQQSNAVRNRVKLAEKRGIDNSTASAFIGSSKGDKVVMRNIMKEGKAEQLGEAFKATRNHVKPLGETVFDRWSTVAQKNKQAGAKLDRIAKNNLQGVEVDTRVLQNSFNDTIEALGVNINDKGELLFKGSSIKEIAPARDMVRKAWNVVKDSKGDAYELHRAKQIIDELVTFESAPSGMKGRAESAVRGLRTEINKVLREISDDYRKVNDQYSDTITAMNDFRDAAGRFFDPKNPESTKEILGMVVRGANKNDPISKNLRNAVDGLDLAAGKYGVKYKTDLQTQLLFNDQLEKAMNIKYKTLTEELAGIGPLEGARAARGDIASATADVSLRALRSLLRGDKPNEKAIKALERLVE